MRFFDAGFLPSVIVDACTDFSINTLLSRLNVSGCLELNWTYGLLSRNKEHRRVL